MLLIFDAGYQFGVVSGESAVVRFLFLTHHPEKIPQTLPEFSLVSGTLVSLGSEKRRRAAKLYRFEVTPVTL